MTAIAAFAFLLRPACGVKLYGESRVNAFRNWAEIKQNPPDWLSTMIVLTVPRAPMVASPRVGVPAPMIEIPTPVGTVIARCPRAGSRWNIDNVAVARGMRRAVNDRVHVALVARSRIDRCRLRRVEAEQRADSREQKDGRRCLSVL